MRWFLFGIDPIGQIFLKKKSLARVKYVESRHIIQHKISEYKQVIVKKNKNKRIKDQLCKQSDKM